MQFAWILGKVNEKLFPKFVRTELAKMANRKISPEVHFSRLLGMVFKNEPKRP
jgi:hypothetical protein